MRVLAIDQSSSDKNQKAVSDVKTATLELTPAQAERVVRAQASGTLSLTLRSLVDEQQTSGRDRVLAARARFGADSSDSGEVAVIRYGVLHPDNSASGE